MTTHLVIPDAHAHPDFNNDRFEWLGKFALDLKPDVIVDLGDWADMPSLSSYDRGKKSFEGRRYVRDIAAACDARERFERPIREYNSRQRDTKHRQYLPRKVALYGNHEDRIRRAVELSPELDGAIGLHDLCPTKFGWEVHGFLDPVEVDGIWYSHYFPSGVMLRPIGGEHPAAYVLKAQFVSCIFGHIHLRDFSERTRADGTRILGLTPGCFFDYTMEWAGMANRMWWRGVVVCHNVQNGVYDPEFVSIDRLRAMYG